MPKVRSFTVLPSLPQSLEPLKKIAKNLFWSWNYEYVDLFKRIDSVLWEACGHNPVKLLGSVNQDKLEELSKNQGFLYQLNSASEKLDKALEAPRWFNQIYSEEKTPLIAYFSAEFGIHESMPIYSGGLGILAGDHLKSASDLGVPLVGVGLMYQNGYFRQYLNADGWQQERYVENEFHNMSVKLIRHKNKRPLTISVAFPERKVYAQIWQAQVGRVNLYLLDTNVSKNNPQDREITNALYGGDNEMRIKQEMILGIGGYKALLALDLEPTVCHMNEGHAAFMALERIYHLSSKNEISFEEAADAVKPGNIFTVHTPVAAGCDEFSAEMMDKYFSDYFPKLGLTREQFLSLGRFNVSDDNEAFKMPVLAIKLSDYRNGVSALHGEVSRQMWHGLWSDIDVDEVPISHVTNGIHSKTWVSEELDSLFESYLGSNWSIDVADRKLWDNLDQVPDEELWRIHQRCKEKLIGYARRRLKEQMQKRGASNIELVRAEEVLDPEVLTIGFARRFATYKRGNLLLSDVDRLVKLLSDTDRPVQFIFAGKSHPRDDAGKELIKEIFHFANSAQARSKFLFLEDYDIDVARFMVQGVDVWLNNPRRPLEASGTSGMKAALNGVLNLSILDGWWCEGYGQERGWVIGNGETYEDIAYGDKVECQALYNLIENEITPLYYSRINDKLPRGWIRWMKTCIKNCAPEFSTHRMVADYARKFYAPSAMRFNYMLDNNLAAAKELTAWKRDIQSKWSSIKINEVTLNLDEHSKLLDLNKYDPHIDAGSDLRVTANITLGDIDPSNVAVELYFGRVNANGKIKNATVIEMASESKTKSDGTYLFSGNLDCKISGQHGFSVRVVPKHKNISSPFDLGMVHWDQ